MVLLCGTEASPDVLLILEPLRNGSKSKGSRGRMKGNLRDVGRVSDRQCKDGRGTADSQADWALSLIWHINEDAHQT